MVFPYRSKAVQFSLAAGGEAGAQNTSRYRTPHTPFLLHYPPSEQTRQLAKGYFKLIQAIHHDNIIDTAIANSTPPKGMAKHIAKLTAFVKPSSPTDAVRQALAANTQSWMTNTLKILEDHYLNTTMSLSSLPYDDVAFPIAVNWAKKRFKARLHHASVGEAEALLLCGAENSDDSYESDSAPVTPTRSLVEETHPGLLLGGRQEPQPAVAAQPSAPSAPQTLSQLSPSEFGSPSLSTLTKPQLSPSPPPPPHGRQNPVRTIRKRTKSPPSLSLSTDRGLIEPSTIHPQYQSEAAISDDGSSTSAASNLHFSSAGCVAGPGTGSKPPPGKTLSQQTLQQVVGDKMMRLRHNKHNNVNLLVNTTSSDPTTKNTSAESMLQTSPVSPLTCGESQAAEVTPKKLTVQTKLPFHPNNHRFGKGHPWTNWHPRGIKTNPFSGASIPQVCHGWETCTDDGRGRNIEKKEKLGAFRHQKSLTSEKSWSVVLILPY